MATTSHVRNIERDPSARTPANGHLGPIRWQEKYTLALVASDAAVVALVLLLVMSLRSEPAPWSVLPVVSALTAGWLCLLALEGAYDVRFLGAGAPEYQDVAHATLKYFGLLAIVIVATGWRADRLAFLLALSLGLSFLLAGRKVARTELHRRRAKNDCAFRVLAVGDQEPVRRLASSLRRHPEAGFSVVGTYVPEAAELAVGVAGPGSLSGARVAAESLGADVIALTSSPAVDHDAVQALGWSLERTGISLVFAPSLTDVAARRLSVHPVAGLPLIYVDEPDLGRTRAVVKAVVDRVVAAFALLLSLPVMLLVATLIKLDSPGPVIFKQARVGKDGQLFRVWKFRSMNDGSEALVDQLMADNESDGLLFKMKSDPRVTRVGAWLRRWSLDELPQLVNVLVGQMSLVGPRPLPVSPDSFQGSERRRLLVKPGITGLWQVSGRSDAKWDEASRLDLYYVENWSLWLDLFILWKTISTVFRNTGAY